MKVDDQLVERLATLTRLDFPENSKEEIKLDLEKILTFMEKLNELDTTNVEPLIYVNEEINIFRDDVVKYDITKEEAMSNVPIKDSDYIKVPKMIKSK